MMSNALLIAESQYRTYVETAPLLPITEWWHALLLGLLLLGVVAAIVVLYVFDSVELRTGTAVTLCALRLAAVAGLVLFFLNLEKRTEKQVTRNSRVSVLVDTSSSMATLDGATSSGIPSRRIDAALDALAPETQAQTVSIIDRMRSEHEVAVYKFSEEAPPELLATYPSRRPVMTEDDARGDLLQRQTAAVAQGRRFAVAGLILFGISLTASLVFVAATWMFRAPEFASWTLAVSVLGLLSAVGLIGVADMIASDGNLRVLAGWEDLTPRDTTIGSFEESNENRGAADESSDGEDPDAPPDYVALRSALSPDGIRTRLGDALLAVVNQERGGPIAGIVLVTDGQKTVGGDVETAIATAREAGIPLIPIGLGRPDRPQNVRVSEIQAPQRAYPGDKFNIKGVIQSVGMAGTKVDVRLYSVDAAEQEAETLEAEIAVDLGEDGEPIAVDVEIENSETGQRRYIMRVVPPTDDINQDDNERSALVEIVKRKNRVLMIAGGPTREFRFLRNQLYRDDTIQLDVYLQSARPGIAQEADQLLFDFPTLKEQLFEYDCIIAFDPDWRVMDETQARLLEQWIAEEAGGMIVVAGPVFTPEWTRRPRGDAVIDLIRRLYPVSFFSQGTASLRLGRFGGKNPFPLKFSREGRSAKFLWIADTAEESQSAWNGFAGVFGFYAVNDAKSGATILAEFSDRSTEMNGRLPIYLASQFYGAGRVFFQASGEMWRLRAEDEEYFEQYYTKLIQWVSQGRLLRDSQRGILIADKSQCLLGDAITFQAILRDAQNQPVDVPQLDSIVKLPNDRTETLVFQPVGEEVRAGTYTARLVPTRSGDYRVSLPIPGSADEEVLQLEFSVEIPMFEQQRPERNDALLSRAAERTQGIYFVGMNSALEQGDQSRSKLEEQLVPNHQQTYLPGASDGRFARKLAIWLLVFSTMALCLEWTLRRLHRLA